MTSLYDELCDLLRTRAYRYSETPFTLKSGAQSRHYVDCRRVLLHPGARRMAANLLEHRLHTHDPTRPAAVAGVVLGGVPLADALSTRL